MGSRHIRGPIFYNSFKLLLTGNYTIVNEALVVVNKTVGAATAITLPASTATDGRREVIIVDGKGDALTNNITVTAAGSDTINGAATWVINVNYGAVRLVNTGSGVWTVPAGLSTGITPGTGVAGKALVLDASGNVAMPAAGVIDERNHEIVAATNVILAGENGRVYYLNSATEFVSTLPAPAIGLHFTFIVAAAPSGASYTVVTSGSANIIKGNQNSVAGDAGDFGTSDDTITFVDGQSLAGDKCELFCDGTSWFAYAISKVAAGITFTTAS